MIKVFIGGSVSIKTLPAVVAARVDKIIEKGLGILIGDAPGADLIVQSYLTAKRYEDVVVFFARRCPLDRCRHNLGRWGTSPVDAPGLSGASFHTVKDVEMAEQADYGLMIWDRKSPGTLNNIRNLVGRNKPVVVYLSPSRSFHTLRRPEDLSAILDP